MFGISGMEFVVLAVVALVVIGPDKLPGFAQDAGRFVRQVRRMAKDAQADVAEHLGPEFANIDVRDLNPRAFVQKHLLDDRLDEELAELRALTSLDDAPPPPRAARSEAAGGASAVDLHKPGVPPVRQRPAGSPPPYDGDAT
ncbi:sec-independent protein translocase protein TatB [Motilibacter rhizosphaerae]|uniref:Sec-independent protein translocase protein TatB n=1 Tax=Motilibacter rhizosphaerae TaxID=598652 RepID=A0A4Q7NPX3_9ACTN|nr:sec-independent translocase [Motilibacter rhizosphaerae]RZS87243.1 sec-independent protein translocase protein TatB [Motilibacter rhizosphaerae]